MRRRVELIITLGLIAAVLAGPAALAATADAEKHYQAAMDLLQKEDTAGALTELEKALEDDSKYIPAYLVLAELYLAYKKDAKTALSYCDRAEAIAPGNAGVLRTRGFILIAMGRENLDKAIAVLRKAVALEPKNADGHWLLGRALLAAGTQEEGRAESEKALQLTPDNVNWLVEHARALMDLRDTAEAEKLLLRAVALKKDYFIAHLTLAVLYQSQERHEEATGEYLACLDIQPNNVVVMSNLGVEYAAKGDYVQAISWYQQALDVDPLYATAWYNLACVYARQGKRGPAIEALKKAVQFNARFKDLAKRDPDLESLRGEKEFKDLVAA